MRSFLCLLLRLLGALALILIVAFGTLFALSTHKLHRHFTVGVTPVAVPGGPEAIARGRHVAIIRGCLACHGSDLAGAKVMDDAAMGRVYGPNLTTGPGGCGGRLSNLDWVRAVRHGVAPDGHPLFIMPSKDYAELSDQDLGALLAYIGSVAAVDRTVPDISVGPVARILLATGKIRLAAEEIDQQESGPVPSVPVAVGPEYGRYLAATCSGCHNPHFSGGKIAAGPPSWPSAANLTRGTGSAIAGWTEANFLWALRVGKTPEGKPISPVMPRAFGQMSDIELKALWSYLQTLPPAATGKAPVTGT
jgi:cytochrome c553